MKSPRPTPCTIATTQGLGHRGAGAGRGRRRGRPGEEEAWLERIGRGRGVLWAGLGESRPGIDRKAWLNDFVPGIGGLRRGVAIGLWAWLRNAGL